MNTLIIAGTSIVFLALISYSIGVITEQRKRIVSRTVLLFLSLGLAFDITATTLMILGSSKGPVTLHGFIGYSSLAGMLADNILLWRLRFRFGYNAAVPLKIHLYSRYAYVWWVIAFITGGLLVALGR